MAAEVSLLPASRTTARERLQDHATACERAAKRLTDASTQEHTVVLLESADEARQTLQRSADR